jgi:hypothetical protein
MKHISALKPHNEADRLVFVRPHQVVIILRLKDSET